MSTTPEATAPALDNDVLVHPSLVRSSSSSGAIATDKSQPPRRERSKSRDAGKRMGGGQKASWKVTEVPPAVPLDAHDPNYDSEAEENVVLVSTVVGSPTKSTPTLEPDALAAKELAINAPPEVKKRVIEILEEYFTNGDAEEVLSSLQELNEPEFQYEVVKRAITMAMDKHDKERELASRLVSTLYLDGLTAGQVLMGFRRVLLLAGDLQIDIPSAKNMLAIFCARAVVDEILPPSFLEDPFITRYAPEIAAEAIKKLSINHATARMEKAWGPGDGRPVEELKVAIDQLTKEYLLSSDLEEAARCVRELNVPHFHHEVVKRGITNSLEEGGETSSAAMASLLTYLVSHEVVSTGQLLKGFERFKLVLDDVALDIPNATAMFQDIVTRGISDGILPKTFDANPVKK
uniref:MI domain-containing protein n=1 Tax=Peronospora matthiolae TaxID=2874970 RepID=A0AAV1TW22_9STRA